MSGADATADEGPGPGFLARFFAAATRGLFIVLGRLLWRIEVVGAESVPRKGPVLLVPNHVSFVDWWLVGIAAGRPLRYVIDRGYYERPLFRAFLRLHRGIPIAASGRPAEVLRSLREAGRHLDGDGAVCIFGEGQIERLGTLLPLQRGVSHLLKGRSAPVVACHVEGIRGSLFAPARGLLVGEGGGFPRRRIRVSFGPARSANTPLATLAQDLSELECEAWIARQDRRRPLHRRLLGPARRRPRLRASVDPTGASSRLGRIAAGVALARRLRRRLPPGGALALLLPPSRAAEAALIAASLAGRPAVPLDPDLLADGAGPLLERAGAASVLVSKRALHRAGITPPEGVEILDVEDLDAEIGPLARAAAAVAALLLPAPLLERFCGAPRALRADDAALILFSSGSTGAPKGVVLEHRQVGANVEQIAQVFPLARRDALLASLPHHHAFGATSFWLAARAGILVVHHPDPEDAIGLGLACERWGATLLVATPGLLDLYRRRIPTPQLGSVRLLVAGAERLSPETSDAFEARFGLRPLQGYGATECSPVIAVSTPDQRRRAIHQVGSRPGAVGRPLPGCALRVVDPETGAAREPGAEGLLLVRGPNVMRGYLDRPDLDAEALREGWFRTGDLGAIDEEGFLRIAGRLSRLARIAGEAVPLDEVEGRLQALAGGEAPRLALVTRPDPRRGERLVLFHLLGDEEIEELLRSAASGPEALPAPWRPEFEDCRRIEALPRLPGGKPDLAALADLAADAGRED